MTQYFTINLRFNSCLTLLAISTLFLSLMATHLLAAPDAMQPEDLFSIRENGKWGFINGNGKMVIEPKYAAVEEESDGMMAVYLDGKIGYVDSSGREIISPQFELAKPFHNGKAIVKKEDSYGLIDKKGNFQKIPYEIFGDFSEGLVRIRKTVINENAKPRKQTLYGYINQDGKVIVEPKYINASEFRKEGLATVSILGENAAININKDGTEAFRIQRKENSAYSYEERHGFEQGLLALKENGWWGYKNTKGEWAIEPRFERASDFNRLGLAQVYQNNRTFWINREGVETPPPSFEPITDFHDGICIGYKDGKRWYINLNGEFAFPFEPFDEIKDFSCGRAAVMRDGLCGYLDTDGKLIIPLQFKSASDFKRGLAYVYQKDGSQSYINTSGKIVWSQKPPETKPLQTFDPSKIQDRQEIYDKAASAQEAFYKRIEEEQKKREENQEKERQEAERLEQEMERKREEALERARELNNRTMNHDVEDKTEEDTSSHSHSTSSDSSASDSKNEEKTETESVWGRWNRKLEELLQELFR